MTMFEKVGKPVLLLFGLLAVLMSYALDAAAQGGDSPTDANSLLQDDRLDLNDSLSSANGAFRLYMQSDGNLVLRNSERNAVWASGTSGKGASRLYMQRDGNLVLRSRAGNAIWSSGTSRANANRLVLNNDGSLAIYAGDTPVWAVNGDGNTEALAEPHIMISSPSNGAIVNAGESFTVQANAFDPDGVQVARLWINGAYHSLDESAPYEFDVNGLEEGLHTLMVRSKDTNSNLMDSEAVTITVLADNPGGDNDNPGSGDDNTDGDLIQLPIEVLGPAGTRKSVTFELNDPSSITHLYLRCNACGYHDIGLDKNPAKVKATVQVNGGSAIPLKHFIEDGRVYGNNNIDIVGGEADYGGIGGGFRTVRMTVPVNGLVRGKNTLTFEHQDAEAPSIGFRIIELNLLENGALYRKVLNENEFAIDDPSFWSPPLNSASAIAKGRDLWRQRNRLTDPWLDALDGQGNGRGSMDGRMRSSCADCHASDGRDLQYFNFSNLSIIERSRFHGLTQADGERIASYIRSLDIPVVDQARPWNPAYQPGPGIDSRPAYEWAAGAGVDAILDDHKDMAPYLFPEGTSLNAVRAVVDRFDTLNFRELPMNIPMPEWNQWLPIIHPADAFDTSAAAIRSDENGNNVGIPFYEKLYNDANNNPTRSNIGDLASRLGSWLRRGGNCEGGAAWRAKNGNVIEASRLPMPSLNWNSCDAIDNSPRALELIEIAKRGLSAWSSVKMWEIVHSKDLEQESEKEGKRVCSDGRCIDASEARGWVVDGRNVFDRPPHFTGTGGGRKYFTQNPMLGILESNTWYHLNMVLNTGYRETMPSHFAYTYSHVELLQEYSNVDQGFRFWATMIKQRQLQTNGKYGIEAGLDLRTAQPFIFYGTARNKTKTDAQSSVGQPLWGRLAQAMVEDFVEYADNATAKNWADANQNRKVQPRDSTNFSACSGTCSFGGDRVQGRDTYRVIPELRKIGVADSAIDDLIDWGEKTWPRGPWDRVR
ncbi:Ig-like domain-containing protein [Allohahella marinimesophila]|uniref:Bulb-type lectin domain-containing protein n=1 Tax=Allohahella marinimesophila TaxID=1054972 RepID=A0ABP7PHJ6_9GAMM